MLALMVGVREYACMPTPAPHINAAQAARANAIVNDSDAAWPTSCETALAAERSDGLWNLYIYAPDNLHVTEPWVRIPPTVERTRRVEVPDAGAVWAGITALYIGDGEHIVMEML